MHLPPRWETLKERASQLPPRPGVYLYQDARGAVIYIGKAKSLRDRVRSYFLQERLADAKTGSLLFEAEDIDFITVNNEKEALALENNLIKQHKPRFNVLLRDDKTYPYIKLTRERYPRVYVTRRLKKDGAAYFGPYFPGNLAHRLVNFIHRSFKIPSCRVDLTRRHPRPCLEYHIHRCWGPCVEGLTTGEIYAGAVDDVKAFLSGRQKDLLQGLRERMEKASDALEFERAAALRDLIATVEELGERQRIAAAEGKDVDIIGLHAEPPLAAVNIFHVRNGRVVDRRELYWEDVREFEPGDFLSSLLVQLYVDQHYVPSLIHVPQEFEGQCALAELLSEKRGAKVEITVPQRGPKKAMLDLVATNARQGFERRFRVLSPTAQEVMSAWRDTLNLPEPDEPRKASTRIECFDISHTQGTDTVASMVVWEDGKMKKSEYRKFIVKRALAGGPGSNDDFASMREVVGRRYRRLKQEGQPMPALVLVDGGVGQLHAAAQALEDLAIINQPLASIAKREETIYIYGQEDEPIRLERFSPVLHTVQRIRDEAHRFAVSFHRQRRGSSRLRSELLQIPGVGEKSVQKLLRHFGSLQNVRARSFEDLAGVVSPAQARSICEYFQRAEAGGPAMKESRAV